MILFSKTNISKLSDLELINRYKENEDIDCIGELYKRYTGFTFSICMKYLKSSEKSNEFVLDIFEDLIEKLLQHDVVNFKTWLYSVTKNHCLLYLRELKKESNSEIDINLQTDEQNITDFLVPSYLQKEEKLAILEKCIEELKDEHKICIKLFFLEQKSYIEVSKYTGFSLKQVKTYIQNGKRNLKLLIEKNYE